MKILWGVTVFNIVTILVGGATLFFLYFVDGYSYNRVITYINGVDPSNLQVEKNEYRRGEVVRYHAAFCKNRPASAETYWFLSNNIRVPYSPKTGNAPVGCVPDGGRTILLEAQAIPEIAISECGYHLEANVVRTIWGGRERTERIATEEFCVVD